MKPFSFLNASSFGLVAIFMAACTEPATSPDAVAIRNVSAAAKGVDASARAIQSSATGYTNLEVTLGDFPSISPTGEIITGTLPGASLKKVHVKFCKESYKDFGVHQFSANFYYKENAVDKEPDGEPDSPADPDDKAKKEVNWDRSAHYTTLNGTGYVKIPFTGIPLGASLEVQVQYRKNVVKNDGKVETKTYEEKFCVTVDPALRIGIERVDGPPNGNLGFTAEYRGLIDVTASGSDAVTMAACLVTVDGAPAATTPAVPISSNVANWCRTDLTFASAGPHVVRFTVIPGDGSVVGASSADVDPAATFVETTVMVGSGDVAGAPIAFALSPNVVETIDSTRVTDTAVYSPTDHRFLGEEVHVVYDQSSTLNTVISRTFTNNVRFIVRQTTQYGNGLIYEINRADFTLTAAQICGAAFTGRGASWYDIRIFCDPGAGTTTVTYRTRGTADYRTASGYVPGTGTFRSYGQKITYEVSMEYLGYRYRLDTSPTQPNIVTDIVSDTKDPYPSGVTTCSPKPLYTLCSSKYVQQRTKNSVGLPIQLFVTPVQIQ
jgi:hypothetical protein